MHEMGEMKRAQELRVEEDSLQNSGENHDTIQKLTSQMQDMQGHMNSVNDSGEISRSGIKAQCQVFFSSQPAKLVPRQTPASWNMECVWTSEKRLLFINFLRLIRSEIMIKEFIIPRHQVLQDRLQGDLSQEMKSKLRVQFQF